MKVSLRSPNIGFNLLTEIINTTSAGGKLFSYIFGALAKLEHNIIQELATAELLAKRDSMVTKTGATQHINTPRMSVNAPTKQEGYPSNPAGVAPETLEV